MNATTETFAEKFARIEARVRERAAQQGLDMEQYSNAVVERTLRPLRRKPEELTPEELDAAEWLIQRHFGKGRSTRPEMGAFDNAQIDADLAREYGSSHEEVSDFSR